MGECALVIYSWLHRKQVGWCDEGLFGALRVVEVFRRVS